MNRMSKHWHVAIGEQGTSYFSLAQFNEKAKAVDFFLNISSEAFKSFEKEDRISLETNMYHALIQPTTMLYEGGNKFMMLIFGCDANNCMIATLN